MIIYNKKDFIDILVRWCYTPSIYGLGAWGWPMYQQNKNRLMVNSGGAYNSKPDRKKVLMATTSKYFAADCVCMIKAILWGFSFDDSSLNGGATYASNGVPDVNETGMINLCYDVSEDFSKITPGEFVWFPGHCGIYVGLRNAVTLKETDSSDKDAMHMVVECTPAGADGVQFSVLDNLKNPPQLKPNLLRRSNWKKHGKLPWISYEDENSDEAKNGIFWEGEGQNITPFLYKKGKKITTPGEHFVDGWKYVHKDGTAAVECDVYIPYVYQGETPGSTEGKWVRYNYNGDMVYGPHVVDGKLYFFDKITGAMYKGRNAVKFMATFDNITGICVGAEEIKEDEPNVEPA